ncbi:hypothetical protein K439DRAFT_1318283, partial [Ramaria rubella]
WFVEIFIPHTAACNVSGQCILLTFNGHHSHVTPELLDATFHHKILLFCLPLHTTHKLQLLYVCVFGPLQTTWSQ